MNTLSLTECIEGVAAAVAALRMLQLRFVKRQPALFSFLVFSALYLCAQGSASPRSYRYFWTYIFGSALDAIIRVSVVREMFALTLVRYPAIRTGGRWTMYSATALSVIVTLVVTATVNRRPHEGSIHLYYIEILNRSIVFSLAVVVVAILLFLRRYPLHLSRNTYISTSFFSAIFLSEAVALMFDSMNNFLYAKEIDVAQVIFGTSCCVAWAVMLRPEPAEIPGPPALIFGNPREQQLLRELDSLNRILGRVGRR